MLIGTGYEVGRQTGGRNKNRLCWWEITERHFQSRKVLGVGNTQQCPTQKGTLALANPLHWCVSVIWRPWARTNTQACEQGWCYCCQWCVHPRGSATHHTAPLQCVWAQKTIWSAKPSLTSLLFDQKWPEIQQWSIINVFSTLIFFLQRKIKGTNSSRQCVSQPF